MMFNHHFKVSLLSLLMFLLIAGLSSCGFQLRGAYELPAAMQSVYIDIVKPKSKLGRALKRNLKASEIRLVESASDDVAILKIIKETKNKRIVSVDSEGRAREYTLTVAIEFSVIAKQADFEIDKQRVQISRDFVFDTEDVLGNSREEAKLYEEMQQDLVRLIMFKLQSYK